MTNPSLSCVRAGIQIVLVACSTGCSGEAAAPDPDPGPEGGVPVVTAARLTPSVAVLGGPGSTLALEIHGTPARQVRASFDARVGVALDGEATRVIDLYDDGTHGDAIQGDHWYSRSGIFPSGQGPVRSTSSSTVDIVTDGERATQYPLKMAFRAIDTLAFPPVAISNPAAGVQAAEHAVAIVTPESDDGTELDRVGTRYFEVFPEDRDFILVLVGPRGSSYSGASYAVHAPFTGTGPAAPAPWIRWGGDRLMRAPVLLQDAWHPTADPEGAFCLATHELAHTWAAYLGLSLSDRAHWATSSTHTRSAFGVSGRCLFNSLELYLAGLLPADSVSGPLAVAGTTIRDVVAHEGPRTPAWPESQRAFTAAWIVAVRAPLTSVELTYHDAVARAYGSPTSALGTTFAGATGGRASLDTRIPPARGLR